jgi:hypothetical protein
MAKTNKSFQSLMDEHVHLPGVGGVVVTRGFAYSWMKETGCDPSARGFGSMDYAIFGQKALNNPLTDLENPAVSNFMEYCQKAIRRDCLGIDDIPEQAAFGFAGV